MNVLRASPFSDCEVASALQLFIFICEELVLTVAVAGGLAVTVLVLPSAAHTAVAAPSIAISIPLAIFMAYFAAFMHL
jgi:hypothetical protein